MSMAIQRSKYTGDPGLFGDIWGGLKGVAKAGLGIASGFPLVGGAAGAARSLLFPGDARMNIPGASTFGWGSVPGYMPPRPTGMPGVGACPPGFTPTPGKAGFCGSGGDVPMLGQVAAPGMLAFSQRMIPGGETGMMAAPMGGDVLSMRAGKASGWPGYHWNKSDYFLRSGEFVPAGAKMVRNRRRNPANPRATSNAIARVKGAKRYAKTLGRITIRDHHHSKH